jgi:hypothetical protein
VVVYIIHYHPPDIPFLIQHISGPAQRISKAKGQLNCPQRDSEIEIMAGTAEQPIPHRATNEINWHIRLRQQRPNALQQG